MKVHGRGNRQPSLFQPREMLAYRLVCLTLCRGSGPPRQHHHEDHGRFGQLLATAIAGGNPPGPRLVSRMRPPIAAMAYSRVIATHVLGLISFEQPHDASMAMRPMGTSRALSPGFQPLMKRAPAKSEGQSQVMEI